MPDVRETFSLACAGTLTTASVDPAGGWEAPFNGQIVAVAALVGTAPTGAALILNLTKNGTVMYTTAANRPTIAISATSTVDQSVPDVSNFVAGDIINLSVPQIGSTVAGANLKLTVEYITT
jgi:hypothetical protein